MGTESDKRMRARLVAAARDGDTSARMEIWDRFPFERGSRHWLEQAANAGVVEAQIELAEHYGSTARPRRPDLEMAWYRRAADQGSGDAANRVGEAYRDGDVDGAPDRREATRWFRRAVELGDPTGELNLGYALFHGHGTRRDRAAALRWYRRAARHGPFRTTAMYNLAQMHREGHGVPQSWPHAIAWYRRAAERGHPDAMDWLARIYNGHEDRPANTRAAVRWLTRAAEAGSADARCDLGVRCYHGDGVPRDRARAARLYRRAAEAGHGWASHLLALCYRDGDGVRRNRAVARTWFARAAAAGERKAEAALRALDAG